jgi:hypothetical protein
MKIVNKKAFIEAQCMSYFALNSNSLSEEYWQAAMQAMREAYGKKSREEFEYLASTWVNLSAEHIAALNLVVENCASASKNKGDN